MAASLWVVVPMGLEVAGLESLDPQAVSDYVDLRQFQTLKGGSQFVPPSPTDPSAIPMVIATVLFRPFPWEAHSAFALIQASDGLILLALGIWKLRRVGRPP